MNFHQLNNKFRKQFVIYRGLILYCLVLLVELIIVNHVSDLKVETINWVGKASEIANLRFPSDNFYGPGAALLVLPFLWLKSKIFLVNVFYFLIGSAAYWFITDSIQVKKLRLVALLMLPSNVYLIWLVHSSQDTVFEFALLSLAVVGLLKQKWILYLCSGLLLAETRSQYWLFFLASSTLLLVIHRKNPLRDRVKFFMPFILLLIVLGSNQVLYKSSSPALEAGLTLELSYSRDYYLAHPKYDVDYLLDGPNGPLLSSSIEAPQKLSQAESNRYYLKTGFEEAVSYPKETILGWMQKIDSFFFITQKVPNLPGYYKLNSKTGTISTVDARLNWILVFGNLIQQLWRIFFLLSFLVAIGIILTSNRLRISLGFRKSSMWLILPWATNAVAAVVFYSESRFKVVSEILVIPSIAMVFSSLESYRMLHKREQGNN